MLRGTVVIDMSGYPSELKNLAVAIILDLFYAQMLNSSHSKLVTTADGGVYRQIKKVILVDEADNIMSSGLPVLKNIIKEGREFGVGMVLSTQYLDHFRGDDEDYRKYMKTWVVHNVENLKRSDVEYVFQLPISDPGAEQLYQRIKQLEKHHSIVRIGTDVPTYMEDLPFFRIAQESRESYLQTEEAEPEATDEEA
jgi:DNA phosphorothioation-dependent restriction protein DptH